MFVRALSIRGWSTLTMRRCAGTSRRSTLACRVLSGRYVSTSISPSAGGDTLLLIEDAEFRLRLAQAEADLANALAGQQVTDAGIATASNNLLVSDAAIDEARVQLDNAERDYRRYEKLLGQGAVTRQEYDHVRTAYEAAQARYEQLSRAGRSTSLLRDEQTRRRGQNEAAVRLARAAVELARLNLSYTVVLAPCDGVTGRKAIDEGQLVQPGQTMVDVVDGGDLWVIANYRETQLPGIRVGAPVSRASSCGRCPRRG